MGVVALDAKGVPNVGDPGATKGAKGASDDPTDGGPRRRLRRANNGTTTDAKT